LDDFELSDDRLLLRVSAMVYRRQHVLRALTWPTFYP
jgi:hypothetical protein